MDKRGVFKKILFVLFLFIAFAWFIKAFEQPILAWLESSPILWAIFQHMRAQVEMRTLLGLGYITFAGNLFLIMFPVEAMAAYYFTLDYNVFAIFFVLVIATLVAQFFNYLVGLLFGRHVLRLIFRKHWEKWEAHSQKWGMWMLVLFSVLPFFPLDSISIFLGSTRYNLKTFWIVIVVTTIIKYLGMLFLAVWFADSVVPRLTQTLPFVTNYLS